MAGQSQRFSRLFHPRARRGLHQRLAPDDPNYVPPPPRKPAELRFEKLALVAIFLLFAAAMLALVLFD